MKNSQTKTIETIGLFTAIISFIFASIPSFKFVHNFHQALLFTGIIGVTLFLMVGLLFLFTRGFEKINSWLIIILSSILFIVSGFFINNSINKLTKDVEDNSLKKVDTIKNDISLEKAQPLNK